MNAVDLVKENIKRSYKYGIPVHFFDSNTVGYSLVRCYRYGTYYVCYTDDLIYDDGVLYLPIECRGVSFDNWKSAVERF